MEKVYFIFGTEEVNCYNENDKIEDLILGIKENRLSDTSFVFTEGETSVFELVNAIVGYNEYCTITEEEYNIIKREI
jgi:hypothetical protein